VTLPVGPRPVAPGEAEPAAGARGANVQRLAGVVLAADRGRPLLEIGGARYLAQPAMAGRQLPALPEGAALRLEIAGSGRTARLLEVAGRALERPVPLRLAPAGPPSPRAPVSATAQLLDRGGEPVGPAHGVRLAGAGPDGATLQLGQGVDAEVLGRDPDGRLLLRAGGRLLRIEDPLDAAAGDRLRLAPPGPPGPARVALAMRTLTDLLGRATDGAAVRMPEGDATLAARLLRFIQLLSGGRGGDAAADERARAEVAGSALERPLAELARLGRETLPGGGRLLLIPFGSPAEAEVLRLYLPADSPDPDGRRRAPADGDDAPRRLILDFPFRHLGRCQLDALCQGRSFRLMVRTAGPLDAGLRQQIEAIFIAACAAAGLKGELGYRPGRLLALPGGHERAGEALTT